MLVSFTPGFNRESKARGNLKTVSTVSPQDVAETVETVIGIQPCLKHRAKAAV